MPPPGPVLPTTHAAPPFAHVATGVTEVDALDKPDVPAEFMAVVVNVYAVLFVKPVTTHEPDAPVTVQVLVTPETCGDALTV